MAKDPAFLFYSSDFLVGVQFMNYDQRGKYISLMCLQHQHGHLKKEHMFSICESHDIDVLDKFVKDSDGLYYNKVLEEVIKKRKAYSESRRNNAKGRTKKDKAYVSPCVTAYAEQMENENEIVNRNENEDGIIYKEAFIDLSIEQEEVLINTFEEDTYMKALNELADRILTGEKNLKPHYEKLKRHCELLVLPKGEEK